MPSMKTRCQRDNWLDFAALLHEERHWASRFAQLALSSGGMWRLTRCLRDTPGLGLHSRIGDDRFRHPMLCPAPAPRRPRPKPGSRQDFVQQSTTAVCRAMRSPLTFLSRSDAPNDVRSRDGYIWTAIGAWLEAERSQPAAALRLRTSQRS
jgi:hypothetical protein